MAYPSGKSPLQFLTTVPMRKWWKAGLEELRNAVVTSHWQRNEILGGGGTLAKGTVTDVALLMTYSAVQVMLKGRLMADIAALADVDVLAVAGSVDAAIYENGDAYTADPITLGNDETAYVTLIICNSNGAGGVVETDGGAPKLIAVVAGTSAATAITATAHLTSVEIQAALEASAAVHDETTGWVHFGQVVWNNPAGTPGATVVLNRNNVISEA